MKRPFAVSKVLIKILNAVASNTRLGRTTNKKEKLSVAREVSISARPLLTCLDIIRQAIQDIVRLKVMEMPTKRMMTVKSPHRIYIYRQK